MSCFVKTREVHLGGPRSILISVAKHACLDCLLKEPVVPTASSLLHYRHPIGHPQPTFIAAKVCLSRDLSHSLCTSSPLNPWGKPVIYLLWPIATDSMHVKCCNSTLQRIRQPDTWGRESGNGFYL